jgi:nucleoside-diphosphate-sugar epimerase
MENKKIVLIGGSGYVGSVLTAHFLKLGYYVTVLDNLIYGHGFVINPFLGDSHYDFIKGDIGDEKLLNSASKGADYILLLAGLVGDPITKKYPKTSEKINNINIKKCIDYFDDKPIEKLIFISTCSNYGLIPEGELADENYPLNPLSLYAKAKVDNELYLLSKKGKVNYTATILRFATAFGLSPRMRFDLTISEFTRELFFKETLVVFDEHTWRPYCHVRDFASLITLVLEAKKENIYFEVFNAGGEKNNATKKMIIDLISSKIKGCKIAFNQNDSDPRNYKVNFNKVQSTLGFTPSISVEDGIDELINAFSLGLFGDSKSNKLQYGNYELNHSID